MIHVEGMRTSGALMQCCCGVPVLSIGGHAIEVREWKYEQPAVLCISSAPASEEAYARKDEGVARDAPIAQASAGWVVRRCWSGHQSIEWELRR